MFKVWAVFVTSGFTRPGELRCLVGDLMERAESPSIGLESPREHCGYCTGLVVEIFSTCPEP